MADEKYLTVPHLDTKTLTRLFSKIAVDLTTGCWVWTAGLTGFGYGKTNLGSEYMTAHRLMYAWLVGPVPYGRGGNSLDHIKCDNPPCCNPAHLKLVTTKANVLRGRGPCAVNARKTHCKRGHLLPDTPGRRRCNICNADEGKARYERLMATDKRDEQLERYKRNQHERMNGPRRAELLALKRANYHATKTLKRPHIGS